MIRVMIVEDEPLIADAHAEYLTRLDGFHVQARAATAHEAITTAIRASSTASPIDLVLLDIGLPDASGVDLASALSGVRPLPDVIAISSQRDLALVRAATSHGVLMYILKPFTFATFREKLEHYRRFRDALPSGTEAVSQRDIDTALAELRTPTRTNAAKKGAAPDTAVLVGRTVRDHPAAMTAAEVAAALGISRVTAWRYLESLADDGVLTRASSYGKTGRPQIQYSWRT